MTLTSKMTIFPLKRAMKCLGSLPIVTLTWTGSSLYFWSKATAWNAQAASSSCVACRPYNINEPNYLIELWHIETAPYCKTPMSCSPATCRAGSTSCCWPSKCKGSGNSLLHRSIRTTVCPQGRAPDSQSSTPEFVQRKKLQVSLLLHSSRWEL